MKEYHTCSVHPTWDRLGIEHWDRSLFTYACNVKYLQVSVLSCQLHYPSLHTTWLAPYRVWLQFAGFFISYHIIRFPLGTGWYVTRNQSKDVLKLNLIQSILNLSEYRTRVLAKMPVAWLPLVYLLTTRLNLDPRKEGSWKKSNWIMRLTKHWNAMNLALSMDFEKPHTIKS